MTDNSPIRIYVNKIENRITFKIKTGYYIDPSTPETKKLLDSNKNKITKVEKVENKHHLRINDVVLVHCNIVNKYYQNNSRILYTFVPNKSIGQLKSFSPKNLCF